MRAGQISHNIGRVIDDNRDKSGYDIAEIIARTLIRNGFRITIPDRELSGEWNDAAAANGWTEEDGS